jgi:signal transduction histidine kinase/ActR/RegA family two-component response regulator
MSLAVHPDPVRPKTESTTPREGVGFLVIEQRSTTPLGPRIIHVNEDLLRLSGYDSGSLIGSPLGLLYDRNDLPSLIGKLQAIASRSTHCFMDRVLLRNGGSRLPCRWTIRSTNREGEPRGFFVLTVRPLLPDIGELMVTKRSGAEAPALPRDDGEPERGKEVERKKESGKDRSDASVSTRHEYESARNESIFLAAAGVAHDFKNALQTIKTNLELASIASPPGSRARVHIHEAQLALGDAEMLARQMLAFTKGESVRKRIIQVGHLLERVSRLCFAGSGIRCRLSVPGFLRCVEGDPTQIYQVLHNLVINARQAMPNGGTIDIVAGNADFRGRNRFAMPPGRYTVVSVRDRGCGISPENLKRIFDPDFSTKAGGNGFGLASCEAIVTGHGGAIRVASKEGVGSEFLVFLPSTDEAPDHDASILSAASPDPVPMPRGQSGSGRILVVEDQPGVARSTMAMLGQLGYECLHAKNGEEAVDLYRKHLDTDEPVDLVLLDMTLPGGLSGTEVASELRRFDRNSRIIATSGYFEPGASLSLAGDFAAALPKPYSMEDLCESLEKAIGR